MKEELVRMTVPMPLSLADHLRDLANRNDRPLSRQIIRSLKDGSGWTPDEIENRKEAS
jgi:hypothetical protein